MELKLELKIKYGKNQYGRQTTVRAYDLLFSLS